MERVTILAAEPYRLLQDGRSHALGSGPDQAQTECTADASAEHVALIDAELVEQRHVVGRVGVPAVTGPYRGAGLPGVALVHRDHAKIRSQLRSRIPGGAPPAFDRRAHSARREEQDREPFPVFFVMERYTVANEARHRPILPSDAR